MAIPIPSTNPGPRAKPLQNSPDPKDRRAWLAWCFQDFKRFCGLLQVQPKQGSGRIPMVLTPIQHDYCDKRTERDIILKPRQVFMTTLEAARDLWWFLTKPGARVVLVCQSQTDMAAMKDMSEKFRIFFESLRRFGLEFEFGRESGTEWTLPKRDATLRIIQAGASEISASKKGRGGTINRLHFTEVAIYEQPEETFTALVDSMSQTESEVVIESTANGAAGFFYDQWRAAVAGESAYRPHFFEWWRHPEYRKPLDAGEVFQPSTVLEKTLLDKGVSEECLNWYRAKLREKGGNQDLVTQEFPSDPDSCFLVEGRGFFDKTKLAEAIAKAQDAPIIQFIRESGAVGQIIRDVEIPALRVWYEPRPKFHYVVSADPSEGTGGDAGAGIVLERGTGRHMATIWGQFKPWELARVCVAVAKRYNFALLAWERNNHGHAFYRGADVEHGYGQRLFVDSDKKFGWNSTEQSRSPALETFERAFRDGPDKGGFETLDRFLLAEMRTFVVNIKPSGKSKAEAMRGHHDDLVMAAAIGWDVICRIMPPQTDLSGVVA